jgi:hypothetical protein
VKRGRFLGRSVFIIALRSPTCSSDSCRDSAAAAVVVAVVAIVAAARTPNRHGAGPDLVTHRSVGNSTSFCRRIRSGGRLLVVRTTLAALRPGLDGPLPPLEFGVHCVDFVRARRPIVLWARIRIRRLNSAPRSTVKARRLRSVRSYANEEKLRLRSSLWHPATNPSWLGVWGWAVNQVASLLGDMCPRTRYSAGLLVLLVA